MVGNALTADMNGNTWITHCATEPTTSLQDMPVSGRGEHRHVPFFISFPILQFLFPTNEDAESH